MAFIPTLGVPRRDIGLVPKSGVSFQFVMFEFLLLVEEQMAMQ